MKSMHAIWSTKSWNIHFINKLHKFQNFFCSELNLLFKIYLFESSVWVCEREREEEEEGEAEREEGRVREGKRYGDREVGRVISIFQPLGHSLNALGTSSGTHWSQELGAYLSLHCAPRIITCSFSRIH